MKAMIVCIAAAGVLASAAAAVAAPVPAGITSGLQRYAKPMGWKATCHAAQSLVTCGLYDPSQTGAMVVGQKRVKAEGQYLFSGAGCTFSVVVSLTGRRIAAVNVCRPGWEKALK